MSWQHRLPHGISNFRETGLGFQASIPIPADEDGFFGRECPDCDRFFKMRVKQWEALSADALVTCPYCGHQPEDADDFLTPQQNQRVDAAAEALIEQYAHQAIKDAFSGLATPRLRPGQSGIQVTVSNDPPPPVRSLPFYVEEQVRRTITCDNCQTEYAVYGATAFCPICGPRTALETVLESIERGRRSLALEDALPEEMREQARADGLFDKTAADAVKETVTLFEVFTRDQFSSRVPKHAEIIRKAGRGVFQRIDDVDALFGQHRGVTLSALVPADVWSRLQTVFQQRHVLVHQQGIVDQQYVDRVPHARQQVGQRLVLGRRDAEQALDALEPLVRAIATSR
jgi:sarcosine oxidase delta subunit